MSYKFNYLSDLQMCDGEFFANYNKFDLDVSVGFFVKNIEFELLKV